MQVYAYFFLIVSKYTISTLKIKYERGNFMNAVKENTINTLIKKCMNVEEYNIKELLCNFETYKEDTEKVKNMTVKEVAIEMGKSESFVRIGLQRGTLTFGVAEKLSSKYTYYISPKKFYEYIGRELPKKYK